MSGGSGNLLAVQRINKASGRVTEAVIAFLLDKSSLDEVRENVIAYDAMDRHGGHSVRPLLSRLDTWLKLLRDGDTENWVSLREAAGRIEVFEFAMDRWGDSKVDPQALVAKAMRKLEPDFL